MKISEILYGLKDISRTIDGASLNLEKEVLDAAIEFIEPYAEMSEAIEEAGDKWQGITAKFKRITVDFEFDELDEVAVTEPEETIITDIDKRIQQLEDIDNFKGILGSDDENFRLRLFNDAIDDLQDYYKAKKEAIEVEAS